MGTPKHGYGLLNLHGLRAEDEGCGPLQKPQSQSGTYTGMASGLSRRLVHGPQAGRRQREKEVSYMGKKGKKPKPGPKY